MDEYKSRLSDYLSGMIREELDKYDGGYTDEWNDQRKKNAEVLGYKLSGKSDIKEAKSRLQSLRDWGKMSDRERSDKIDKFYPKKTRLASLKIWQKLSDRERSDNIVKVMNESINERRGISISEKGMVFFLDQLVNSMEHYDEREFVRGLGKKLGIDSKVMKRIWKNYDKVHASYRDKWTDRHWERWLNKQGITEDTKRDYKAEYKKYGSSTKAKKYRAELNQYNRKKGTYGNNDGKDASHKGGKIVGFEKESTNRGRREKSRLKKEDIREFSGEAGINVYLGGIVSALHKSGIKPKTAKQMKHGFSKSRDKIGFFIDVLDRKREKYTLQLEIDKDGYLWYLSAPKDMKLGKWADESKVVRSLKAISKLPDFGQSSLKRR